MKLDSIDLIINLYIVSIKLTQILLKFLSIYLLSLKNIIVQSNHSKIINNLFYTLQQNEKYAYKNYMNRLINESHLIL